MVHVPRNAKVLYFFLSLVSWIPREVMSVLRNGKVPYIRCNGQRSSARVSPLYHDIIVSGTMVYVGFIVAVAGQGEYIFFFNNSPP